MLIAAVCVSLSLIAGSGSPVGQGSKKYVVPRVVPMTNSTLIPLHDLVVDHAPRAVGKPSKFFISGHFYLGGKTNKLANLKGRLRWYFLTSSQDDFDPSASWIDISSNSRYPKQLVLRQMPWVAEQGTRIDFSVRVPKAASQSTLAISLVGKNKNPDKPGTNEVKEASIVTFAFPSSVVESSGTPTTDTVVPITTHFKWGYQTSDKKSHVVFAHAKQMLEEVRVFVSTSKSLAFPPLGHLGRWKQINDFESGEYRKQHSNEYRVDRKYGSFLLFAEKGITYTPENRHREWSAVIRTNK
jgi:hypothetical protein